MDKARKKADKLLKQTERKINNAYFENKKLKEAAWNFQKFMEKAESKCQKEYEDYINATENKEEYKRIYAEKAKNTILYSREYKTLLKRLTEAVSNTTQSALDIVNGEMAEIYAMSYNQVADECRRVGIKVGKGKN